MHHIQTFKNKDMYVLCIFFSHHKIFSISSFCFCSLQLQFIAFCSSVRRLLIQVMCLCCSVYVPRILFFSCFIFNFILASQVRCVDVFSHLTLPITSFSIKQIKFCVNSMFSYQRKKQYNIRSSTVNSELFASFTVVTLGDKLKKINTKY